MVILSDAPARLKPDAVEETTRPARWPAQPDDFAAAHARVLAAAEELLDATDDLLHDHAPNDPRTVLEVAGLANRWSETEFEEPVLNDQASGVFADAVALHLVVGNLVGGLKSHGLRPPSW